MLSRVDDFFHGLEAVKPFAAQVTFSIPDNFVIGSVESVFDFAVILAAPWARWMRVQITNAHSLLFYVLDKPQEKPSQGLLV